MNEKTYDISFLMLGIFFGAIALALAMFRENLIWIIVSFLFFFLILSLSKINKYEIIKWKTIKIVWIPLLLGSFAPIYSPLSKIAFAAILPIFGFMILLSFIYNNDDFRTNFPFSAAFIFLFTLAGGALSGIWRFMSDRYFDTSYLFGNEYLMVDLLVILMFGLVGVFVFVRCKDEYYSKNKFSLKTEQLKTELIVKKQYPLPYFFRYLNTYFKSKKRKTTIRLSLIFQMSILVLVFGNIIINSSWGFFVTMICFMLSVVPPIYSLFSKVRISASFQFWVSGSLFLYALGESLNFHPTLRLWNPFTHVLAGVIVGSIIITFLFYLNDISFNLYIPPKMIPLFVLIFILSIGVIWELFEFFIDNLFGRNLQPNLQNTVNDLISNTIGAFFAILIANFLTPFETFTLDHKKEKDLTDTPFPFLRIPFSVLGLIMILFGIISIPIFVISYVPNISTQINLLLFLFSILSMIVLLVIFIFLINYLWEGFQTTYNFIAHKNKVFFKLFIARVLSLFEAFTEVLEKKKEIKLEDISCIPLNILIGSLGIIGILFGVISVPIFVVLSASNISSQINLILYLFSILSIVVLLVIFILSINDLWENFEYLLNNFINNKRI